MGVLHASGWRNMSNTTVVIGTGCLTSRFSVRCSLLGPCIVVLWLYSALLSLQRKRKDLVSGWARERSQFIEDSSALLEEAEQVAIGKAAIAAERWVLSQVLSPISSQLPYPKATYDALCIMCVSCAFCMWSWHTWQAQWDAWEFYSCQAYYVWHV
jgi:hypothetical protein